MKVAELRAIVKAHGIKGYSKMNKAELEALVQGLETVDEYLEWSRKTTPGDGSGIGSFSYCATIACAMRIISETDYFYVIDAIHNAGSLEDLYNDTRARKIIQRIPSVFQFRHEGCKGLIVKYPLEFVEGLEDKDLIIPESVRKFATSADFGDVPFEICNFSKKKNNWVGLNPQFIQSLVNLKSNGLNDIVKFWFNKLEESISDIPKALEFHGILSSVGDNSQSDDVNSNLVVALRASTDLIDDFQIRNWRKAQYEKFINEMKIGRLLVPGQYTYMICDPTYMLNSIYDMELDCLQPGEYWFNNSTAQAGLFRSPLIAPFETQKVQLVSKEDYWFYRDVVIFNGFDGIWENMGGADFDGDTCAIVPDDTSLGKIIVDGISEPGYVVWEPGMQAVKRPFSWEQLAEFNTATACTDRTGIITNFASRALDVYNHLHAAIEWAEYFGCNTVTLVDPQESRPNMVPFANKDTFVIRGFRECKYNKDSRRIEWLPGGIVGTYTFDEINNIADNFLYKVEYLRLLQGREIDGAKTGIYAEGESGEDFVENVKFKVSPHHMITRQKILGRPVSSTSEEMSYVSLSPLGRVHDLVEMMSVDFYDKLLNNGSNKTALLLSLLTEDERKALNTPIAFASGASRSLVDIMKDRKMAYNANTYLLFSSDISEEERKTAFESLRNKEISDIIDFVNTLNPLGYNISMQTVAVAMYIATYAKDGKFGTGLSYGWLLFDELISVFSRSDKRTELVRVPDITEEASIVNGVLFVNGIRKGVVPEAVDSEFLLVQTINDHKYALVHKRVDLVVKREIVNNIGKAYNIDRISGFKYYGLTKDQFKASVSANGSQFDIDYDEQGNLNVYVNGQTFARISSQSTDTSFADLAGHTVRTAYSENYSETEATLLNLQVVVVA